MVLGIMEGRIEIQTERLSYNQGELLRGKVILQLNAPKKARALRIRFYGRRKIHTFSGGKARTKTETVFEQDKTLAGEGEYPTGTTEYEFEIRLPSLPRPTDSTFTDLYCDVNWYLNASLDIPFSFDINKRQKFSIMR